MCHVRRDDAADGGATIVWHTKIGEWVLLHHGEVVFWIAHCPWCGRPLGGPP